MLTEHSFKKNQKFGNVTPERGGKEISFRRSKRDQVIFSILYSFITSTKTFYIEFRSCNLFRRLDRSTGQAPTATLISGLYGREDKVKVYQEEKRLRLVA